MMGSRRRASQTSRPGCMARSGARCTRRRPLPSWQYEAMIMPGHFFFFSPVSGPAGCSVVSRWSRGDGFWSAVGGSSLPPGSSRRIFDSARVAAEKCPAPKPCLGPNSRSAVYSVSRPSATSALVHGRAVSGCVRLCPAPLVVAVWPGIGARHPGAHLSRGPRPRVAWLGTSLLDEEMHLGGSEVGTWPRDHGPAKLDR